MRLTAREYRKLNGLPGSTPTASRRKYGNEPTAVEDQLMGRILFDSKHEARVYAGLALARRTGLIVTLLRQVRIDLPGGVRMRLDFMTIGVNGDVRWIDAKGHPTRDWLNKRKIAQQVHGIEIEVV